MEWKNKQNTVCEGGGHGILFFHFNRSLITTTAANYAMCNDDPRITSIGQQTAK